jgi:hypothetical protein
MAERVARRVYALISTLDSIGVYRRTQGFIMHTGIHGTQGH